MSQAQVNWGRLVTSVQENDSLGPMLLLNPAYPFPERFVNILSRDGSWAISYKLWYEGFSEGCGNCGGKSHEFETCELHGNEVASVKFQPVGSAQAEQNARATSTMIMNALYKDHVPKQNTTKKVIFVQETAISASQRQFNALYNNTISSSSQRQLTQGNQIQPVTRAQNIHEQASLSQDPGQSSKSPLEQLALFLSPEVVAKMKELALLVDSPLFKNSTIHQLSSAQLDKSISPSGSVFTQLQTMAHALRIWSKFLKLQQLQPGRTTFCCIRRTNSRQEGEGSLICNTKNKKEEAKEE